MTAPSKRKGDKAELEVQELLREHLGVPARRMLGAGRADDIGDIDGVPDTTIQVVNRKDLARALREKPDECAIQQARAEAEWMQLGDEYDFDGGSLVIVTRWSDGSTPEPPEPPLCEYGQPAHGEVPCELAHARTDRGEVVDRDEFPTPEPQLPDVTELPEWRELAARSEQWLWDRPSTAVSVVSAALSLIRAVDSRGEN